MCEECENIKLSHCHVHSDASRIDGLGSVSRLVKAAKTKGFDHLALTDHGSLTNSIAFTAAAKSVGIKPVIGVEAYVVLSGQTFHLTLLGDGNKGFNSLTKLNNSGQKGEFNKPAFHFDLLKKYSDGVICLTGCPASPLQALEYSEAYDIGLKLKNIYGNNLFSEAMFVSHSNPWIRAQQLCRDLDIKPVLTNDVHFPYQEDAASHEILVRLKAAFSYNSSALFLATPHELIKRIQGLAPEFLDFAKRGMRNSYRLLSKLSSPSWSGVPTLPYVKDAEEFIRKICLDRVNQFLLKFPEKSSAEYFNRMEYELDIISSMGFMTYFYILNDIISYSRGVGVRVGPGRGSGAGSLVLFLLNITEVDPIEHGLKFERFLNPKRKEMPDVDIDLDSDSRELTIEYARTRWGGMPVATYSRYTETVTIADLCRFFRVPRELSAAAADEGVNGESFERVNRMFPLALPTYSAMLGQIRHIGQHPGGIIITDENVPLERTAHGDLVAAWTEGENRELTQAGIVKYDLLGISALTILKRLEEKHKQKAPFPVNDAPEFEIFRSGDLTGIFQFSGSSGISDFTKKVAPTKFEDLVAINALYRPGALDSGAAKHYPEWRKKPRKFHPIVDKILEETYGIICYQEQFMELFSTFTGGDLADADLARKLIVKSKLGDPEWELKMSQLKNNFFVGGTKLKIDKKIVETLWSEIITHSRYSFNKSHSVAYALIAWQMAWWKYHFATDFYAVILSIDPVQAQKYLFDVVDRGIEIVPPDINKSSKDYESDGKKIYLPLTSIKYLGENGVNAILEKRPFVSIKHFMSKITKREAVATARTGLWEMGAFSSIPGTFDELDIKKGKPIPMSEWDKQKKYLGFLLPTVSLMEAIRQAKSDGMLAGIVSEILDRESKHGPYKVYRLIPDGTFWSRNMKNLIEDGQIIKVKIKKDSGKALYVFPLLDK